MNNNSARHNYSSDLSLYTFDKKKRTMKKLKHVTFGLEEELCEFVNENNILPENIIAINLGITPFTGKPVFFLFYFKE